MRPPPPCLIGCSIRGVAGRKPAISGPCCVMVSHCGAIGSIPMANGRNGPAPPGAVFHYHPGRKSEYADQILTGFDGIIQGEEGQQTVRGTVCPTNAYGGYSHLAKPDRKGGKPLKLALRLGAWTTKVDCSQTPERPIFGKTGHRGRGAAAHRGTLQGRGCHPRFRSRLPPCCPSGIVLDCWWTNSSPRLSAQAKRVSRKTDLGEAMAYMLKRQDGFRLFLGDGRVDMDSNLVENAIRSPAMNRRNALFAPSRDFGLTKTLPGNGP